MTCLALPFSQFLQSFGHRWMSAMPLGGMEQAKTKHIYLPISQFLPPNGIAAVWQARTDEATGELSATAWFLLAMISSTSSWLIWIKFSLWIAGFQLI